MAILAGSADATAQADLNAPLDVRPTLKSEILRGWNAAQRCQIGLPPLDYALCVTRVIDEDQARNGVPDPFVLGATLREWFIADIAVQTDAKLTDNAYAQAEAPEARRQCAAAALVAAGLQRKLGLTDAQLMAATGAVDPTGILARWAWWKSQPLSQIAYPDR
jgi:hypothetical protein